MQMEPSVSNLIANLNHPMAKEIDQLRQLILASDESITEGIKWNSMSFRTTEWFATLNQRALDRVEFVFHLGAKVRDIDVRNSLPALEGCLTWKSADRCLVTFRDSSAVDEKRPQFQAFVKAWIVFVR